MGSVLFFFEIHAAVGTKAASHRCCMMVKNRMRGPPWREKVLKLNCMQLGCDVLSHQQSKFCNAVAAPNKCRSGTCIVAGLEIDTQTSESAIASRIASLPGNIALSGDGYSKGDLPASQHAARLRKYSIAFQIRSVARWMLQLGVIGILGQRKAMVLSTTVPLHREDWKHFS